MARVDWIRKTAVAGTFYPKDPVILRESLDSFFGPPAVETRKSPVAVIAPHAGYIYSGRIAGTVYRRLNLPQRVVIACPNHSGFGKRIAVWSEGAWETPLGRVTVDEPLAARLLEKMGEKSGDREAHRFEHAIEVHLPFLQYLRPDVKIVPLVLGPLRLEECLRLGEAMTSALSDLSPEECLLVASTDMSHYIPAGEARAKDELALEALRRADAAQLYRTVAGNDISMCGVIPTVTLLEAAVRRGASTGEVLAYGNSGEVTGSPHSVVGYAAAWVL